MITFFELGADMFTCQNKIAENGKKIIRLLKPYNKSTVTV